MAESIMLEQCLGWAGNIGFFLGAIYIAKKNTIGWWCQLLANILYINQAWILQNSSLLWLSIILGFVNIYGIYKWGVGKHV